MKSFLKRCMEEAGLSSNGGNVNVSVTGPLAETYAKVLDVIYSKENTENTLSTETQANDHIMLSQLANIVSGNVYNKPQDETTIYGVAKMDVDDNHVVEVSTQLADTSDPSNFIVVIDAMGAEINPVENNVNHELVDVGNAKMVSALESVAKEYGAQVYHSFADVLKKFEVKK